MSRAGQQLGSALLGIAGAALTLLQWHDWVPWVSWLLNRIDSQFHTLAMLCPVCAVLGLGGVIFPYKMDRSEDLNKQREAVHRDVSQVFTILNKLSPQWRTIIILGFVSGLANSFLLWIQRP